MIIVRFKQKKFYYYIYLKNISIINTYKRKIVKQKVKFLF